MMEELGRVCRVRLSCQGALGQGFSDFVWPAVATASSAISASLGYQDGEKIKRSTLIDLTKRIARSVTVPVTADMESGYGETLAELEMTAQQILEAGVAGVNIEDSLEGGGALRTIEDQCERISLLRQVADRHGVHPVINARVDGYFSPSCTNKEEATEEAVVRAQAYARAGADCVYPMGPADEATVRLLRDRIECPINILVSPSAASLSVLQNIGVNRFSFGPFIFRSCLRTFADIVDQLLTTGDYGCLSGMMTRGESEEFIQREHE